MSHRSFTVEEANGLIPTLEAVFARIERRKTKIRAYAARIEVLELLWSDELGSEVNPDHQEYLDHKHAIQRQVRAIQRLVREEIVRRGIRFPAGGVENGLVDFPSTYQGRWVYLCWRTGESAVKFWHETDAGFPGRQSITERQKRKMGREDDPAELDDSALDF